jgi:BirA family transcriptional regulator, biotin operon repressor / biotin---[acetyl-CoA-carboxylase] ligase
VTSVEQRTDAARPPLPARALAAALVRDGSLVTDLRVVPRTGSTNDDVAELARAGAPEGLVVVAEEQTGGRGRLDRGWRSPPRAGLTFSVLLRPPAGVPAHRRVWLPLLAGLAVQRAVEPLAAVPVRLKWPNDVLLGTERGKVAGILMQADGGAVVVGIGLNVTTDRGELPPGGTSLAVEGAGCTDRGLLLRAILRRLGNLYAAWCAAGGDPEPVRGAYEAVCDTLGRPVRVLLPDGAALTGTATGLDTGGRLVLATPAGPLAVAAGDVTHVRPT